MARYRASMLSIGSIVPFSVAGKSTTVVQYQANGIYSNSVTLAVVATKPAIFTLNQSGKGAAAADQS